MSEGDKMPVTVYQIDQFPFYGLSFEQTIDEMIAETAKKGEKFHYTLELLQPYDTSKYKIRLYRALRTDPPNWVKFLKNVLHEDSRLFKAKNWLHSFVCFIGYGADIYAITGGQGHNVIKRYVYDQFGLDMLIRLVERDSKVIKEIHDRGVTGIVLGQTKFYRGDQRFADENDFGKIFKAVKAELNSSILTKHFHYAESMLKRKAAHCIAKDTFKLGTSIDFPFFLKLVESFDAVQRLPEKFRINQVKLISRRIPQNLELIEKLNLAFLNYIWEHCQKRELPDIDFCAKDFEAYMTASRYYLHVNSEDIERFDSRVTLKEVIETLQERQAYHDASIEEFDYTVMRRRVSTTNEIGSEGTDESVWDHLHGELFHDEKSYFRVDGEWYHIEQQFIKELNEECSRIIDEHWEEKLPLNLYDLSKSEGFYNQGHVGQAQTLVFDTLTPENIECCDIMIHESNAIYLVHVKKGFDNAVRDLASQVRMAAKRLEEDLRGKYVYIAKLQARLNQCADGSKLKEQRLKENHLKELFKKVKPAGVVFCFAVVDKSENDRSIKDHLKDFRSNIAKYSLIELRKQILGMGFGFKIIQLKRTAPPIKKKK